MGYCIIHAIFAPRGKDIYNISRKAKVVRVDGILQRKLSRIKCQKQNYLQRNLESFSLTLSHVLRIPVTQYVNSFVLKMCQDYDTLPLLLFQQVISAGGRNANINTL